jgi:hypothetical protein
MKYFPLHVTQPPTTNHNKISIMCFILSSHRLYYREFTCVSVCIDSIVLFLYCSIHSGDGVVLLLFTSVCIDSIVLFLYCSIHSGDGVVLLLFTSVCIDSIVLFLYCSIHSGDGVVLLLFTSILCLCA